MGSLAARVTDMVAHPLPGILGPGPGSINVITGGLPSWRGLPAAAAAALQAAKAVSDAVITTAEAAVVAAAGTPAAPAALAAEKTAKAAAMTAMSSMMSSLAASCAGLGGMPDLHICATPALPPPPHGPGMVIDGSPTVLVNGLPFCAVGDNVLEALGPLDPIVMGCPTVMVGKAGSAGPIAELIGAIKAAIAAAAAGINPLSSLVDTMKAIANAAINAALGLVAKIGELAKGVADKLKQFASEFIKKAAEAMSSKRKSRPAAIPEAMSPKMKKALGLTQIAGTADQHDAELVAAELAKMSDADLDKMAKNGTKVVVCRGSVTEYRDDLKGVKPRGWPEGSTWDNVPGAKMGDSKEVVIATTGHDTPAGAHVPKTGEGHGSANLVVHESAHGLDLDSNPKGHDDPAFQKARDADKEHLSDYENQAGDAGLQETFAEGMARSVEGNDSKTPELSKYYKSR